MCRDFRHPPRIRGDLRSSGMLRSVCGNSLPALLTVESQLRKYQVQRRFTLRRSNIKGQECLAFVITKTGQKK